MKKLFLKLLILFLPVILIIVIMILFPLPFNSYYLAIIDKHRLLEHAGTPRMVLAGGSNLAFSIDSELIQNTLDIPVINAGVSLNFGLGRILDDLAPFLNSGDILVVVPEYHLFESLWNGSDAAYMMIFDARQYRLLVKPGLYGFPSGLKFHLKRKVSAMIPRRPNPLASSRDGFNEYGDYVKHLAHENRQFASFTQVKELNERDLELFFQLIDAFTLRGITVLISYPSFEEPLFLASEPFIRKLDAAFRDKPLTVISKPEDYAFPRNYFYDSSYHLNARGRELRTVRLIRDLERYFQDSFIVSPPN
jgi:hypothetical protein